MKKIKKTFLYLLGFAFLLFAFAVIINLSIFDEELLPEIQAIKDIKTKSYTKNNAYPAMVAINGPSGMSLQDASTKIRIKLNEKIKRSGLDYLSHDELNDLIGNGHDKSWKDAYGSCGSRTDNDCMSKIFSEVKENPIADARLIEQLVRYNDFIQHEDYQEMIQLDFSAPFGPYGPIINLKRLFLADSYANHSSKSYLNLVMKDMIFWRMVLKNANWLITKMVTIATLNDDINSLSTSIKQLHFNADQLTHLQHLITPLNSDEISMVRVFEFEFKYGMNVLDEALENGEITELTNASTPFFYQHQATHNYSYLNITKPLKKASLMNSNEYFLYRNDSI